MAQLPMDVIRKIINENDVALHAGFIDCKTAAIKALNEYAISQKPVDGRFDYKMQKTIFDTIGHCMDIITSLEDGL